MRDWQHVCGLCGCVCVCMWEKVGSAEQGRVTTVKDGERERGERKKRKGGVYAEILSLIG